MSPRIPISGTRIVKNLNELSALIRRDGTPTQIRIWGMSTGTTASPARTYWLLYRTKTTEGRQRAYRERLFVRDENPRSQLYQKAVAKNLAECGQVLMARIASLRTMFADVDVDIESAERTGAQMCT